ncbi:MAG TPA: hypothetical protein VGA53_02805 [Candidatus Paceibacterota bacterium]
MNIRLVFLTLGIFLFFAIHLFFLDKFPFVETNEAWWADIANQYSKTGAFRSSLLDGVSSFGQNYVLAPRIVLFPQALIFEHFGVGLFQARMVGFFIYLALVGVFFLAAKQLIPNAFIRNGIFLLFLVNPLIISAVHTSRPEFALVALAFLGAFLVIRKAVLQMRFRYWALCAAGALVGLVAELHALTAFAAAVGLGVALLVEVAQKRLPLFSIVPFVGGGFFGLIPLGMKIALNFTMWREQLEIYSVDYYYPIVSWWPNVGRMLLEEGIRYLNLLRWFDTTLLLFLAVPVLAVFAFHRKQERALVVLISIYAFTLAAISIHKYVHYLVPAAPFVFLLVGVWLSYFITRLAEKTNEWTVTMAKVSFVLFLIPSVFLSLWAMQKETLWNQAEIFAATRGFISEEPKDTLVVGEFIWWFGLYEYDYRATHWLWQREFQDDLHVAEVLSEQLPVILFIDRNWLSRYTTESQWTYWHSWREGEQEELFRFTREHCKVLQPETARTLGMNVYKCS